jgi:5'-nucleotidase
VQYGIFAILKRKPDLVVAGINYGEQPATDITLSGTAGAALEAASYGIPALAVSLQLATEDFFGYSRDTDFSTAAVFTRRFAKLLLSRPMPEDVHVLNINVPLVPRLKPLENGPPGSPSLFCGLPEGTLRTRRYSAY